MRKLSEKIQGIPPSATIEITDKARRMIKEGKDVISLSIGEPDFDTPGHITEACINALKEGKTHYESSRGIPELCSAISDKLKSENRIFTSPDNVIVSCGAKDTIYEGVQACINPGDEVLILDPSWVSYDPIVMLADGKPVHHSLDDVHFQLKDDVLEKIAPKTRMMIFNTPSNPAGSVLNSESLNLIKDICEDNDIIALADEIYEKLIYEKEHISVASLGDMHERTITVNGFSKAYAMTGWRIGYASAPDEIIKPMTKIQQHTISHPTTFAMWGAVAALKGDQSCVENMRQEFDSRRKYITGALSEMGMRTAPAEGAFYAFVNTGGDDTEVAAEWLEKAHVAATPGTAFNTPGWIRLSYAAGTDRLREAMRRISELSD